MGSFLWLVLLVGVFGALIGVLVLMGRVGRNSAPPDGSPRYAFDLDGPSSGLDGPAGGLDGADGD
jgi:hypothetical protein